MKKVILSRVQVYMIVSRFRQVWQWSEEPKILRKISKKCAFCEYEFKSQKECYVDHIEAVGGYQGCWKEYSDRMFVPLEGLQPLCKSCHDAKTKEERAEGREKKKKQLDIL